MDTFSFFKSFLAFVALTILKILFVNGNFSKTKRPYKVVIRRWYQRSCQKREWKIVKSTTIEIKFLITYIFLLKVFLACILIWHFLIKNTLYYKYL